MAHPPAPKELTDGQQAFALAYVETGNAAEAARLAGYAEGAAKQAGFRLLLKPHVAAEVRRLSRSIIDAAVPQAVAVLRDLMDSPDVDPRERVRAADAILRHARPNAGPAVAVQVNAGGSPADVIRAAKAAAWAAPPVRRLPAGDEDAEAD